MVRVLMWMTPGGDRVFGGHIIQMAKTEEALRATSVDVFSARTPAPPVKGCDIVHGFGLTPEEIRHARSAGARVVLSSIYWPSSYEMLLRRVNDGIGVRGALRHRLGRAWRHVRPRPVQTSRTALAFESADMLLPNAIGEAQSIAADLGVTTPMRVIPNGVDTDLFAGGPPWSERKVDVLSVGRIEPHKNQLGLLVALERQDLSVSIVGPAHPDHRDYVDAVTAKAKATGAEVIVGEIAHHELPPLFADARVHALTSVFETTGLVSLEALRMGCNVVSTRQGYAVEYLHDDGWYCDPASPASIRSGCLAALAAPVDGAAQERVARDYSWSAVATATREAYGAVLGRVC